MTASVICNLQVSANAKLLFDFTASDSIADAVEKGSSISLTTNITGTAVRIKTGPVNKWPGITLPLEGGLDATAYKAVTAQIRNPGYTPITVSWRIDSRGTAVCDTHYAELIKASRSVGEQLYSESKAGGEL
ncbi:hypothetical protein P4B35_21970 [Pontiellaceae bacterium B12227]|nr:hypothetical protein [Pontiellaceae bacterium B12227]